MSIKTIKINGKTIAVVNSDEKIITDAQSALDFAMTTQYETGADRIAVNKEAFVREFFVLSSGLAGDVLQKFINYHIKLAVFGDFSGYTSKPLIAFMYESNNGSDIFFLNSEDEAVAKLGEV